ncbi:migration and invasion enhancer 1 [Vespa velutina]|uniref:migration and invasion enhancer 1 n=1 Tax=Vespa crabro TaxID=7445 RepID=UPI001F01F18D|nr:migration and invasion enhancer 1 [Vespa crabro]XP_047344701.1 migration and invasion enhancer 1 [Vespa velutina]XP_047344702.1 migration and invasion enhancer 1 [Vespa velutina]
MHDVKVNIEYCETCNYKPQFLDMVNLIEKNVPTAKVSGTEGKEGSFEIKINDELVYSKLQTLAFPDYEAVCETIKDVSNGEPVKKVTKQQPIECTIS